MSSHNHRPSLSSTSSRGGSSTSDSSSSNEPEAESELLYSRDEIIKDVNDFYEFMIKLHIPHSSLRLPPDSGWANINAKTMAPLKKNDTVIDLMRHLPYIHKEDYSWGYQILQNCAAADYAGPDAQESIRDPSIGLMSVEPPTWLVQLPAHILVFGVALTREGYWMFLDTNYGTMTLYTASGASDVIYTGTVKHKWVPWESLDNWKNQPTWPVKDCFEVLKQDFRDLYLIRIGQASVIFNYEGRESSEEIFPQYAEIHRNCGWPTQHFRKDECARLINEYEEWETKQSLILKPAAN